MTITVRGEKSGNHSGHLLLSDDRSTFIFKPDKKFDTDEKVLVNVDAETLGIKLLKYVFTTSDIANYDSKVWEKNLDNLHLNKKLNEQDTVGTITVINGVAVPSDFPKMNISISKETSKGKIFIGSGGGIAYAMILENDGTPYFYKRFSGLDEVRDFKVQPTGTLTLRLQGNLHCFVEMDSQYTVIDTLRAGNGYDTNDHECQLLPDHNYYIIARDFQQIDMSKLVSGGNPDATVLGSTVQELDKDHNVIFEWRSWDHFNITDAVHENLKSNFIDAVHMNSIAVDYDSNIVVSSRHLSEVTKIDRKTGKIIWRLGGKNNQFTFINDPVGFSYQHDARPVPGKPDYYTIFDNGNYHNPPFSRAVEYKIDTAAMTATLVWEYRHSHDYYTFFLGSVQRLPNGNTFIDWANTSLPKAFEVTPSGEIVYSAKSDKNILCYRAFRFDWESVVKVPYLLIESYPDKISLIFNKFGDKKVEKYIIYAGLSPQSLEPIDSTGNTWINLRKLTNNKYYFRVTARDSNGIESQFSNEDSALVHFVNAGNNLVYNGDFSAGKNYWQFTLSNEGNATTIVNNHGEYAVFIQNGGTQRSSIQLFQSGISLENGKPYIFEFDAYSTENRIIDARIEQNGGSSTNYSQTSIVSLDTIKSHKSFNFTMSYPSDPDAKVVFNLGQNVDTVYIDNVSIKEVVTGVQEQ
ncbi:MAG: aryl-sulfate sulfotransferase, partial [Ignavibacteriaceae bacterium]